MIYSVVYIGGHRSQWKKAKMNNLHPWPLKKLNLGTKKFWISCRGSKVPFWQFFIFAKMALLNPCMKFKKFFGSFEALWKWRIVASTNMGYYSENQVFRGVTIWVLCSKRGCYYPRHVTNRGVLVLGLYGMLINFWKTDGANIFRWLLTWHFNK